MNADQFERLMSRVYGDMITLYDEHCIMCHGAGKVQPTPEEYFAEMLKGIDHVTRVVRAARMQPHGTA